MKCPDCGTKLNKVYTKSEYGTAIELNQCPSCGGIWFDKWELYPLSREKAKHIDKLNLGKLHHRNPVKQDVKLCPLCKQKLEVFKDPNLPKDFEIERCLKCGGLWLNQGETIKYKKYQEEKRKKSKRKAKTVKNKKLEKDIERLLELHRSPNTLGKAAKFLSTPLNPNTKENVTAEKVVSITGTLLNLLLRLIFRSVK
ncbi:zf-TFIIB domain-containing protein [Candidatus Parcubacteria bacterium]|nr:zf-TFIIB domain-containing protein [Candidatus Parcubacteria bacterium]